MFSDLRQFKDKMVARLLVRFPALFNRWERKGDFTTHLDSPWVPIQKPIPQSKIALITTAGVHLTSQKPFDMKNAEGDASYREIPFDISTEKLKITHNYYDHRDADDDINVVFPIERLQTLFQMKDVGAINHRHFSFMGHIIKNQLERLLSETTPQVVKLLKEDAVDIVILSPA